MSEILACSPKYSKLPILSWTIKYFQKTNYSHLAIYSNGLVVDSTGKDTRIWAYHDFTKRYKVEERVELDARITDREFLWWSVRYLNREYGYIQLLGLFLMMIGLRKNNYKNMSDRRLICSELVVLFLRDMYHVDISDSDDYDLVRAMTLSKEVRDACNTR